MALAVVIGDVNPVTAFDHEAAGLLVGAKVDVRVHLIGDVPSLHRIRHDRHETSPLFWVGRARPHGIESGKALPGLYPSTPSSPTASTARHLCESTAFEMTHISAAWRVK